MHKKNSYKSSKKSAFSLVELSIVLIIIGLLVGGVTGGASLIKSAELRGVSTEATAWKVGVAAFVAQFDANPGDYNGGVIAGGALAPSAVTGVAVIRPGQITGGTGFNPDQDGLIEYEQGESYGALYDLRNVGASEFTPPAMATTASGITLNAANVIAQSGNPTGRLPASKFKGSGWVFDAVAPGTGAATTGGFNMSGNYIVLTGNMPAFAPTATQTPLRGPAANTQSAVGIMDPFDARSIDVKTDDGIPGTGGVIAVPKTLPAANTCVTAAGNAGAYSAPATKNRDCAIAFSVDAS